MKDDCFRITLCAEMSKDSDKLGMQFCKNTFGPGYVTFSIPERLAGEMHKVKQKKIDGLQNEHPNIEVNQKKKMVLIEIDTPGIQKDIDPREYETFIRNKIGEEIHSTLKALMKTTGGSGGRTAYGDRKLIDSIAKVLYQSHNFLEQEEKVLSASTDRSIVVCVANKGVISLGGCNIMQQNDNKKAQSSSSEPASNISSVALNNLCVLSKFNSKRNIC